MSLRYGDDIVGLLDNAEDYVYRYPFRLGKPGADVETGAVVFDVYSCESGESMLSKITLRPKHAKRLAIEILGRLP